MRERSEALPGITTLGVDAEVLVLEPVSDLADPDPDADDHVPDTKATPALPLPEVPDLAASLHEERQALDPQDINKRIEKLRPRPKPHQAGDDAGHTHITHAKFIQLTNTLIYGFTSAQLSAYYASIRKIKQHGVYRHIIHHIKEKQGTNRQPIKRSKWHPGTTNFDKRLPGIDVTVRTRAALVSKPLLVDSILRECWGLVILEEMEALGEIEMSLEPWELAFISLGNTNSLIDTVGRARHAKMQIHRGHCILRITANKTSAEYAAEDIEKALVNPYLSKLDLRKWQPRLTPGTAPKRAYMTSLFPQASLDAVSTRTNTVIEATSGSHLLIRGYDAISIQEAERALLNLLPLKSETLISVDMQKVIDATGSCYLLLVFMADSILDQVGRHKSYGRNWIPTAASSSSSFTLENAQEWQEQGSAAHHQPTNVSVANDSLVDRAVTAIKRDFELKPKISWKRKIPKEHTRGEMALFEYKTGNWPTKAEFRLTAEFGQALFPFTPTTSTTEGDATLSYTSPPTFVSNIPGLSGLLTSPLITGTDRGYAPSIIYEFMAVPGQNLYTRDQIFPELRITMHMGSAGVKPYLGSLTITFQQSTHYILLPDKAVDIRFCSSAQLTLPEAYKVENVKDWIADVLDNLESGDRLTAPDLKLRIPQWTVQGFSFSTERFSQVHFRVKNIQLVQDVSAAMLDTRMTYNSIQGGKFGANNGVLSAHYNSEPDRRLTDEKALAAFVRKGLDIADVITSFGAQTVPLMKAMNPRAVSSARKLMRQKALPKLDG